MYMLPLSLLYKTRCTRMGNNSSLSSSSIPSLVLSPVIIRRSGREACSEEIMERICNQSGHCERHKDVLWNQECRKMFHCASRGVYLREVYLRKPCKLCQ